MQAVNEKAALSTRGTSIGDLFFSFGSRASTYTGQRTECPITRLGWSPSWPSRGPAPAASTPQGQKRPESRCRILLKDLLCEMRLEFVELVMHAQQGDVLLPHIGLPEPVEEKLGHGSATLSNARRPSGFTLSWSVTHLSLRVMRDVSILQAPEGWRLPLAAPPPWPRTRLPFTAPPIAPARKEDSPASLRANSCEHSSTGRYTQLMLWRGEGGWGQGKRNRIQEWTQNHVRAPQLYNVFTTNGRTSACSHAFHTHVTVYFSFLFFAFLQPFLTQLMLWRLAGVGPGRCNPEVDRPTPE